MSHYDEEQGFFVDMCGKCGEEGPLVAGEIEGCVTAQHGSFVLRLCRPCRETTSVEQALELLVSGPRPRRVSLLEQLKVLAERVTSLEKKTAGRRR